MQLQSYRLLSAEDRWFAEAFALYESSFPLHEQRTEQKQRALLGCAAYHFDVLLEEGALAGILLYWVLSGYTYIEHFAIHPAQRGKSLGSCALSGFCGECAPVILEIDPPVDAIAMRREGFYTRLGFIKNGYAHTHPAYREAYAPHALVVMSYPQAITAGEYALFSRELESIVMRDSPRGKK